MRAAAGLLFVWGVGASVGPTLIGLIMEWIGRGRALSSTTGAGYRVRGAVRALPRLPPPRQDAEGAERLTSPVPNVNNVYGAPELDPRGEFHHARLAGGRRTSRFVE